MDFGNVFDHYFTDIKKGSAEPNLLLTLNLIL